MATSAKFSFAHIVQEPNRGAQTFALYGPPKLGKTTLLCGIPRLFILCPEEGLKGIDWPATHFPRAPRNLADLYEAFEAFAEGNRGPERPFCHLGLDSLSWVETMIHGAAGEDDLTKAKRIVLEANDATAIGKAFIALSKLKLTPEDRSAIAEQLRHEKASLSTAAA